MGLWTNVANEPRWRLRHCSPLTNFRGSTGFGGCYLFLPRISLYTTDSSIVGATSDNSHRVLRRPIELAAHLRQLLVFKRMTLNSFQWQFIQARRGVLPSYHEPRVEFAVQGMFGSPGFGDYWDQIGRSGFRPEFVEFVEKQRSKAA